MNVGVKKCRNRLCGNIIYDYQDAWDNDYCDDDCIQEVRMQHDARGESTTNRHRKNKTNMKWLEPQTLFPHKFLDIMLVIN